MCFVIAGVDILLQEQLSFVQRLKSDLERGGNAEGRLEVKVFEEAFHGWLECEFVFTLSYSNSIIFIVGDGARLINK
jgi:hypothetical protein